MKNMTKNGITLPEDLLLVAGLLKCITYHNERTETSRLNALHLVNKFFKYTTERTTRNKLMQYLRFHIGHLLELKHHIEYAVKNYTNISSKDEIRAFIAATAFANIDSYNTIFSKSNAQELLSHILWDMDINFEDQLMNTKRRESEIQEFIDKSIVAFKESQKNQKPLTIDDLLRRD